MTHRPLLLLPLVLLCSLAAYGQRHYATDEYAFTHYLIGSALKDEAAVLLRPYGADGDTMSYLKGYTYYSTRQLDSAIYYLASVDSASALYAEARLFAALSSAHSGRYDEAHTLLAPLATTADTALLNLLRLEQAGLHLLQRDLTAFDSCTALLNTADYRLSQEATALAALRTTITERQRSPLLAACLSAVVPGLGRIYGGNLGEGLATLLTVGSLGAIAAENGIREGPLNWKTLLFGSVAAVFYIGNIYGSAVTVSVATQNRKQQTDVQILYNIHIPIRNSYRH